ncbi:MAG: hypothetical protein EHM47_03365 [Ignavibacteriales bacterium]|nr:MAG: hypothetical protein EHM47_03365 [Ignavibacteriales bacterium]
MLIHKIFVIMYLSLFLIGCATTYAPGDWLPETEEVSRQAYGGWITIITYPDTINSEEKWFQYGGEFISTDKNNVYLLYDTVYTIPKNNILKVTLELDEKSSVEYGLWTFGGTVSTISNGYYLIFTAPFWLLTGIPATVGESNRDRYEAENPDLNYWTSVQKFARFPQGLPDNIELKDLKSKIIFN